jgi:hypothetical protein
MESGKLLWEKGRKTNDMRKEENEMPKPILVTGMAGADFIFAASTGTFWIAYCRLRSPCRKHRMAKGGTNAIGDSVDNIVGSYMYRICCVGTVRRFRKSL